MADKAPKPVRKRTVKSVAPKNAEKPATRTRKPAVKTTRAKSSVPKKRLTPESAAVTLKLDPWYGVVVALAGMIVQLLGVVVDFALHRLSPALAITESPFSFSNPGHLLIGIGIALAYVGLLWCLVLSGLQSSKLYLGAAAAIALLGVLALSTVLSSQGDAPGTPGHGHGAPVTTPKVTAPASPPRTAPPALGTPPPAPSAPLQPSPRP